MIRKEQETDFRDEWSRNRKMYNIFTDGTSIPLDGVCGCGVLVYEGESLVYSLSEHLGKGSDNYADYMAVLRAIEWLSSNNCECEVTIHIDSDLVLKNLLGGVVSVVSAETTKMDGRVRDALNSFPQTIRLKPHSSGLPFYLAYQGALSR